jgi:hypothetical protein
MVHLHSDFDCQCKSLGLLKKGVLGLGLTLVYLYYYFACQGMSLGLFNRVCSD